MIRKLVGTPFLYLLIFAIYVIGLSGMSVPLTGDQKVYLSIALEMREKGEWITPYLFNVVNFLKPPFQYWATLLGWKVFGFNLFGALLPSVLALLATVYLVNRIADLLPLTQNKNNGDGLTGLNSSVENTSLAQKNYLPGLFFASSLGTMTYGTTAQMEIWIVCFYLWAWKEFLQNRYLRAFLVVGVMAWIKGPLYPVLWVASVAFWFGLNREGAKFFSKRFLSGLAVGAAVGLLWYFLAARTHYQEMMDVFFKKENMGKLQTNQGTAAGLWAEFIYSLFPWVFLLLATLTQKITWQRIRGHSKFYLSFALIPALFFSFFPYHVNTYLYLLTPLFAWIIADSAPVADEQVSMNSSFFRERFFLILPSVFAVFFIFLLYRLGSGGWIGLEITVPFAVVLVIWSWCSYQKRVTAVALLSLLMVNLIRVGAVELGEKDIADLRTEVQSTTPPLAYFVDELDIWHEYGLISAAIGQPIARIYDKKEIPVFLNKGGVILFQDRQVEAESALVENLKCQPWSRLKKRMKFPLKTLLIEGLPYGAPLLMRNYLICSAASPKSN